MSTKIDIEQDLGGSNSSKSTEYPYRQVIVLLAVYAIVVFGFVVLFGLTNDQRLRIPLITSSNEPHIASVIGIAIVTVTIAWLLNSWVVIAVPVIAWAVFAALIPGCGGESGCPGAYAGLFIVVGVAPLALIGFGARRICRVLMGPPNRSSVN